MWRRILIVGVCLAVGGGPAFAGACALTCLGAHAPCHDLGAAGIAVNQPDGEPDADPDDSPDRGTTLSACVFAATAAIANDVRPIVVSITRLPAATAPGAVAPAHLTPPEEPPRR